MKARLYETVRDKFKRKKQRWRVIGYSLLPNVNLPSLTGEFSLDRRSLEEVFLIPKLSKLVVEVIVR